MTCGQSRGCSYILVGCTSLHGRRNILGFARKIPRTKHVCAAGSRRQKVAKTVFKRYDGWTRENAPQPTVFCVRTWKPRCITKYMFINQMDTRINTPGLSKNSAQSMSLQPRGQEMFSWDKHPLSTATCMLKVQDEVSSTAEGF